MKEDSWRKDNEGRISDEASGSIRGYLGGIWEASRGIWKHLKTSGDIQGPYNPESGDIKGPSEKGGSSTIVKMGSKRRDRPFYRRVAKVGGTKYRKTHGILQNYIKYNAFTRRFWGSEPLWPHFNDRKNPPTPSGHDPEPQTPHQRWGRTKRTLGRSLYREK